MKIKNIELKVIKADIARLSVDAIVNPVASDFKAVKALLPLGKVIRAKGGKLKAKYVFHGVTVDKNNQASENSIRQVTANAISLAAKLKLKSLALPALGCGAAGFQIVGAAKIMAQEVLRLRQQKEISLKEIIFCVYDEKIFAAFKKTVENYVWHIQEELGFEPYVTVDIIIEINGGVVIIERSNPPYGWAIPGGFLDPGESLEVAALREAREETGLRLKNLRQFHTYSKPGRDPRFHTVSTVFTAKGVGKPKAASDAKNLKVVKRAELLKYQYAFDHKDVLKDYLRFTKK